MTKITINIDDHVGEDEKASIARSAFRAACDRRAQDDFERILSNAGYHLVEREVDAVFDGAMAETIKAKAVEVIENLSEFTVFRNPNAWDRDESKGWRALQDALSEHDGLIKKRVAEIIEGIGADKLEGEINERIVPAIMERLTGRSE